MESFVLQVSWAATAACFTVGFVAMFVTSFVGLMWAVLKLRYWMEVQWKQMQADSEAEIIRIETGQGQPETAWRKQ